MPWKGYALDIIDQRISVKGPRALRKSETHPSETVFAEKEYSINECRQNPRAKARGCQLDPDYSRTLLCEAANDGATETPLIQGKKSGEELTLRVHRKYELHCWPAGFHKTSSDCRWCLYPGVTVLYVTQRSHRLCLHMITLTLLPPCPFSPAVSSPILLHGVSVDLLSEAQVFVPHPQP